MTEHTSEERRESIRRRVQQGDLFAGSQLACRRLRRNAGVTMTALAEKMGVSKSSVSQFEYSDGPWQTDTIGRYIHACGATIDDFFRELARVQRREPADGRLMLRADPLPHVNRDSTMKAMAALFERVQQNSEQIDSLTRAVATGLSGKAAEPSSDDRFIEFLRALHKS